MIFWHMIDIDEEVSESWCVPPEGFVEVIEEVIILFKKNIFFFIIFFFRLKKIFFFFFFFFKRMKILKLLDSVKSLLTN
jgi:hypothetical protein